MTAKKQHTAYKHPQKDDLTKNSEGIDTVIAQQREKESRLYTVRVNRNTWIVVPQSKATPEYAARYQRDKINRL